MDADATSQQQHACWYSSICIIFFKTSTEKQSTTKGEKHLICEKTFIQILKWLKICLWISPVRPSSWHFNVTAWHVSLLLTLSNSLNKMHCLYIVDDRKGLYCQSSQDSQSWFLLLFILWNIFMIFSHKSRDKCINTKARQLLSRKKQLYFNLWFSASKNAGSTFV